MELRQLKYFAKLAETLNFSLASRELFITQSTLSHQILQLENELGQPLFLRNSHEVILTEAGQTLLPLAKETLRSAENCLVTATHYQYKVKVEMNTVYLLFRLARESNYVTLLSESTVVGEQGLKAVPIVDAHNHTDVMQGCIHLIRNAYVKNSAKEFIRMLGESHSILRNSL